MKVLPAPFDPAMEAESPTSQMKGGVARRVSMSERLWGIDWRVLLPWTFDDVRVEYSRFADVEPFIADLYPKTFNVERQWLSEGTTEAKRRFGEEMDVFTFCADEKIVGVVAGHPTDWSTYYWRTAAILPEYRQRQLLTRLTERVGGPLRDVGVARMEVDTSPANRPMVRLFCSHGFIVTSTISSERWGINLRFTKFLDEEAERIYVAQFLDIPKTTTAERSRT